MERSRSGEEEGGEEEGRGGGEGGDLSYQQRESI